MNQEYDHFEINLNDRETIPLQPLYQMLLTVLILNIGIFITQTPNAKFSMAPFIFASFFIIIFYSVVSAIRVGIVNLFAGVPRVIFEGSKITLTPYDVIGRPRTFDCEDLRSITLTKFLWWKSLIITVGRSSYAFPIRAFVHESDIDTLRQAIRDRLTRSETGRIRWSDIEALGETNRIFGEIVPWGTISLGLICCGIFFTQASIISNQDIFGFMRLGANVPQLISGGDLYRLVSANLMHLNFVHLFGNMIFLAIFGTLAERQIGFPKFLIVIGISGLCAQICSALWILYSKKFLISLGLSGALFGVFGALAVLHLRYASQQPGWYHMPLKGWVSLLVANLLFLPFLVPQIDYAAHIGGLIGGILTMTILVIGTDHLIALRHSSRGTMSAVGVLVTLWGAGAIAAVDEYFQPERFNSQLGGFVQALEYYDTLPPPVENAIAWAVAMDPAASPDMLKNALFLIDRAIKTDPKSKLAAQINLSAFTDTMATVQYRLGNFVRAVELEQTIFERQNPIYQSKLARFYDAYLLKNDPRFFGDHNVPLPKLILVMPDTSNMPPLIYVPADSIRAHGGDIFALIKQGGRLLGLVRLKIGPNYMEGESMPNIRLDEPLKTDPKGGELTIHLAYFYTACDCALSSGRANYFAMKDDVRNWP